MDVTYKHDTLRRVQGRGRVTQMKNLFIQWFLMAASEAMLTGRISSRFNSLTARRYTTRSVGSHDPVATAMHELGPHMKHLESPIERGIECSSWFIDRINGYPEYLRTYSKYFKPMHALHCINLMTLQPALLASNPKALGDWATVCSINSSGMGMPEAASKLVRVFYLDLLVLSNKLSSSQKQALSTVLEHRMQYLHARHLQEMHRKFINEYHSIEDAKMRADILKLADSDFLLVIMDAGMNLAISRMRVDSPIMTEKPELITLALRLWKRSMNRMYKQREYKDDRVNYTYLLFRKMVDNTNLSSEETKAVASAARFITAYMLRVEEIFEFVKSSDKTINNQAKQRLSTLLPFDE